MRNTFKKLLTILPVIVGLCISTSSYANGLCDEMDTLVAKYLNQSFTYSPLNTDKTGKEGLTVMQMNTLQFEANVIVGSVLKQYALTPDSLACEFVASQREGLHVATSADSKFKAYSWNTYTGGTMPNYNGFIQYVATNNELHLHEMQSPLEEEPLHSLVSQVFTEVVNNRPTYMLVTNGVFATMPRNQTVTLYQIADDKLISPKLFKTRSGVTDNISFGYNFFSVLDNNVNEASLFSYDKAKQILQFPVVVESIEYPYGEVTNRTIHYQLDGPYFRRVRN